MGGDRSDQDYRPAAGVKLGRLLPRHLRGCELGGVVRAVDIDFEGLGDGLWVAFEEGLVGAYAGCRDAASWLRRGKQKLRDTGGPYLGRKHSQAIDAAEVLDDLVEGFFQQVVVCDIGPTTNGVISGCLLPRT